MEVIAAESQATSVVANQASTSLQGQVNIALLAKTLDFQENLVAELFQALGIGQNLDVTG